MTATTAVPAASTAVSTATRVVVGVDASDHALRALRWARDEARLRGAALEVVHAYPPAEVTFLPVMVVLPSDAELEGTRGLGGFEELLLGSVSHQVATHAGCPVVIVGGETR